MIKDTEISRYYRRWFESDCIDKFYDKDVHDFFTSEVELLKKIDSVSTVLDIGCACGHFIKLLNSRFENFHYTGIDLVPEQIEKAEKSYPEAKFLCGNVFNLALDLNGFDLVNATGVIQHEPAFENLVEIIIKLSYRYALFDVKIAETDVHISDIKKSRSGSELHPILYNVFSPEILIKSLKKLALCYGICSIDMHGYTSRSRDNTQICVDIDSLYSVGVLCVKDGGLSCKINYSGDKSFCSLMRKYEL